MREEIFVFGSNLAGLHGRGAAKTAYEEHGAEYGVGHGPTGRAYAIPTKGQRLEVLPLQTINWFVKSFIQYAKQHPELVFNITAIGCGLAGYSAWQIAPMFKGAPENCRLPESFKI